MVSPKGGTNTAEDVESKIRRDRKKARRVQQGRVTIWTDGGGGRGGKS